MQTTWSSPSRRAWRSSTGRTKNFFMTEALAAEIDRLEYECGILKDIEDYRAGRLETVTLDELEESLGLGD